MHHSCYPHPPGCRPRPYEGVLLPKIAACEKRMITRLCTMLHVAGLPDCLQAPVRIVRLEPCCIPPTCLPGAADCCGRRPVKVCIPVEVCVCDACGAHHTGSATVECETHLPANMAGTWQERLLILPCLRLLDSQCSCDGCFEVQLHIALDFYLLCFQPHLMHPPMPSCPDLPLYPQPPRMSYMSQLPTCR